MERDYHAVEAGLNGDDYRIHRKDMDCLLRAINERVFYAKNPETGELEPPIRPWKLQFKSVYWEFTKQIKKRSFIATPDLEEKYFELFSGRKRLIYKNAWEALRRRGLLDSDSNVRGFMKVEKFNYTSKPNAVPRLIQPRHPVYNICLGVFLKRLEHQIYDILNDICGGPTVMKGVTNITTGRIIQEAWDSFAKPVAITLDISRLDQHVGEQALEYEHSIYKMFYRGRHLDRLSDLLDRQIYYRSMASCQEGKIVYTAFNKPMRCSGDNNTSMGNVILIVGACYSIFNRLFRNRKIRIINNGDDCVIITERANVYAGLEKDITAEFRGLGFPVVLEPLVYEMEQIVFCQTQPIRTNHGTVAVRKLSTLLSKDLACDKKFTSDEHFYSWLRAVGEGGARSNTDIPVVNEYYNMIYRFGVKHSITPRRRYKDELENPYSIRRYSGRGKFEPFGAACPSDESRLSFYVATNVTPVEQRALERRFRTIRFDRPDLTAVTDAIRHGATLVEILGWGA